MKTLIRTTFIFVVGRSSIAHPIDSVNDYVEDYIYQSQKTGHHTMGEMFDETISLEPGLYTAEIDFDYNDPLQSEIGEITSLFQWDVIRDKL